MQYLGHWRNVRVVGGVVAAILGIYLTCLLYQQVVLQVSRYFGVHSVTLSYETLFRKELPFQIEEWFTRAREDGRLASAARSDLVAELLEQFPLVERVSWAMYVPGQLRCHITGVKPTFLVNEKLIAGSNGQLYTHHDFTGYQQRLPAVRIASDWLTPAVFGTIHRFLMSLPATLFQTFDLYYHDPYTIALVPIKKEEVTLEAVCLVDEQSMHRIPAIQEFWQLCTDTIARKESAHTMRPVCLLDVRFEGRIISRCLSRLELLQLQRVA